jgi:uncharacterized small protein (DUF1192 family)
VAKFIPVEPEKWAEMVKAMAENARLKALTVEMDKTINASQAECRRLKAEVERLTSDLQMEKENEDRLVREWQKANNEVYGLQTQVAALIDDQTRLKAEVERLQMEQKIKAIPVEAKLVDRIAELKAEVEAQAKRWAESEDLISHYKEQRDEVINDCQCSRLKAEVERLTKEGAAVSDIKRYKAAGSEVVRTDPIGDLVLYIDYARLKAEVERLEHQVNYWRIEAETDNARWLRCLEDKERLTNAGDAMAKRLIYQGYPETVPAWNAAKEGKQS